MTEYAAEMRAEASSWASAYLQFETGRGREGYRAYAFVEDEDDKSFYQQALSEYAGLCYLGCGGKDGVLSVYKKISSRALGDGNLFFVDRDTESDPFEFKDEVLRTERYSWESHVCEPEFVGWLLQRKLTPNLTVAEQSATEALWKDTVGAFKGVFDKHTALCQTALSLRTTLGMKDVIFWMDAEWSDGLLKPGPKSLDWYEDKMALALKAGAERNDIEERERQFAARDTLVVARGKTLFAILRKFVAHTQKAFSRSTAFQLNSPKSWAEAMPHSDARLAYIHAYAAARIGVP